MRDKIFWNPSIRWHLAELVREVFAGVIEVHPFVVLHNSAEYGPANKVGTHRVLKPCVNCTAVHDIRKPELLQASETLELR
jgi:hypothetical protein